MLYSSAVQKARTLSGNEGGIMGLHPEMLGPYTQRQDRAERGLIEADGQTKCECGCGEIVPKGCTLIVRENGDKVALDCLRYDEWEVVMKKIFTREVLLEIGWQIAIVIPLVVIIILGLRWLSEEYTRKNATGRKFFGWWINDDNQGWAIFQARVVFRTLWMARTCFVEWVHLGCGWTQPRDHETVSRDELRFALAVAK